MTRREKEVLVARVLRAGGCMFSGERRRLMGMSGAELEVVARLAERARKAGEAVETLAARRPEVDMLDTSTRVG